MQFAAVLGLSSSHPIMSSKSNASTITDVSKISKFIVELKNDKLNGRRFDIIKYFQKEVVQMDQIDYISN